MTALTPTSLLQATQQAALANALATTGSTGSAATAASAGPNALQQLGTNFTQFLSLLTTQLQNQDPTQPLDTNSFTQELVEFTGVQQSVATNTNLSQLISLQQGSEVLQSGQVVGHVATVSSGEIALQNGTGELSFNTATPEPIQISIVNAAGQPIRDISAISQAGNNTWTWDGKDNNGVAVADGAYGVAVETGDDTGAVAVPFSVVGTATGLSNTATGLQVQIGALSVGVGAIQAISSN